MRQLSRPGQNFCVAQAASAMTLAHSRTHRRIGRTHSTDSHDASIAGAQEIQRLGPLASRHFTTSDALALCAYIRAVQPARDLISEEAPDSRSSSTDSKCPFIAACIRGVCPSSSQTFASAPRSSSSLTTSECPWPAAKNIIDRPSDMVVPILAPRSSNSSTIRSCPCCAASISAVPPR